MTEDLATTSTWPDNILPAVRRAVDRAPDAATMIEFHAEVMRGLRVLADERSDGTAARLLTACEPWPTTTGGAMVPAGEARAALK
jgi:hypothetical protein